jgi:hypothetical protein
VFVGIPQRSKVFSERQSKLPANRLELPPISFPHANRSVGVCFLDPDVFLKKVIY